MLASYRKAGGDPGDDALVAFFAVYRALVRAKVALVRAGQAEDRDRRLADARRRLALAERLAWRVRRPGLVVVAGLSATGKTTLAGLLADRSGLSHLSSDAVRKQLLGIAPAARAGAAAYGPSFNRRTYEELGRRARAALEQHGGAIVDATFRDREDRAAFLGTLGGLPEAAIVVECRAPLSVRLERAAPAQVRRISDADAGVVQAADRRRPSGRRRAARPARRAPHRPAGGGCARRPGRLARRPPQPPASVVPRKGTRSRADGRSGRRP